MDETAEGEKSQRKAFLENRTIAEGRNQWKEALGLMGDSN